MFSQSSRFRVTRMTGSTYDRLRWQHLAPRLRKVVSVITRSRHNPIQSWPSCCFYVPSAGRGGMVRSNYVWDHGVDSKWEHRIISRKPVQANFEEIGPENDLANFLSVHLTNPYSDNMAEPDGIRHWGGKKVRISYICHERIDVNLTIASRGISNVGRCKIYKESVIFSTVFALTAIIFITNGDISYSCFDTRVQNVSLAPRFPYTEENSSRKPRHDRRRKHLHVVKFNNIYILNFRWSLAVIKFVKRSPVFPCMGPRFLFWRHPRCSCARMRPDNMHERFEFPISDWIANPCAPWVTANLTHEVGGWNFSGHTFWNIHRYDTNVIRRGGQHFCCAPTPGFEPGLVSDHRSARNVQAATGADLNFINPG